MSKLHMIANIQVCIGLASILVGLLLVVAPGTALFSGYEASISSAFWSDEALSVEARRMSHWLLATCGAGVVGWGIAWAMIAHIPLRRGERWAWRCLIISLCVWAVIDLAVAIWFGVIGEVLFVLAAFSFAVAPLLVSASSYKNKHE